ncbi:MAG: GNAT family N-acetyltransferase [Chloroflexota bacterium]|nr:GNAT family N-acetyltransferase [Chloroflexota bacterium]
MAASSIIPAIRRLRLNDLATFRLIAGTGAHHAETSVRSSPAFPFAERWREMSSATFAAYAASGCSYLAEVEGQLVGYLLAQPISYQDGSPLTIWVDAIAVHPSYQRQQIGTALYHVLGAWARTAGVKAILTRINTANEAAVALHQRAGFEPHGTGAIVWRLESE